MKTVNMTRGEYLNELVLLYKARTDMNGDQARKYVLDAADEFLESYDIDVGVQEAFIEDTMTWVN